MRQGDRVNDSGSSSAGVMDILLLCKRESYSTRVLLINNFWNDIAFTIIPHHGRTLSRKG